MLLLARQATTGAESVVIATVARRSVSTARATAKHNSSSSAVHIKIKPRTRDTHESREILRALKRFGEVIWYQNLRFDRANPAPNTLICIYEHASSAAELIRSSPMRIQVSPPPPISETVLSPASMDLMQAFPQARQKFRGWNWQNGSMQAAASDGIGADSTKAPSRDLKKFVLNANVSRADHEATLQQKEFSWEFRDHRRSYMEAALARDVPERGMATLPLDSRTVPSRIVAQKNKQVAEQVEDIRRRLHL